MALVFIDFIKQICTYNIPGLINTYWHIKFEERHIYAHSHNCIYVFSCPFCFSKCSLCSIINITFFHQIFFKSISFQDLTLSSVSP